MAGFMQINEVATPFTPGIWGGEDAVDAVDWSTGIPRAAKVLAADTVIFKENAEACVSTMSLADGHAAEKFYPENTRYMRTRRDSGMFNLHAELCGAMMEAGHTDASVTDAYALSPVKANRITPIGRAVLLNERAMICPWSGVTYGFAMCKRVAKFAHHCHPNCFIVFGDDGKAHVVTRSKMIKAGDPLTVSIIRHLHSDTMCACYRDSLMQRRLGRPCACAECARARGRAHAMKATTCRSGYKDEDGAECMRSLAPDLKAFAGDVGTPTDAWTTICGPTDFLAYLTQSEVIGKALIDAWVRCGTFIVTRPYLISRFVQKLALLGDCYANSLAPLRSVARKMFVDLADATAKLPVNCVLTSVALMRMVMMSDPDVSPEIAYEETARRIGTAVDTMDAAYPWMGTGGSVNAMPWLVARQPDAADNIRLMWEISHENSGGRNGMERFITRVKPDPDAIYTRLEQMDPKELSAMIPPSERRNPAAIALLHGDPAAHAWAVSTVASALYMHNVVEEEARASAKEQEEVPLPDAAADMRVPDACATCSGRAKNHCARCGLWQYCTVACQHVDWPAHKTNSCRPLLSKPLGSSSSQAAIMAEWEHWPLRTTMVRNCPNSAASMVRNMMGRAAARAGTKDEVDPAEMDEAALAGAAMMRFMRPTCDKLGCDETAREKFRACTGCASVFYCSTDHAKEHWPVHRHNCRKAKKA